MQFILSALRAAIPAGTPLLFGTLGEVYTERSGVLNLGIEGMMIMGSVTAFGVAHTTGNVWLAILLAALAGGLLALLHAFASITLKVNQVVSGLAITMLGLGVSGMMGKRYIGQPLDAGFTAVDIPLLSDIPIFGPLLFQFDPLVYLAILLVPLLWFVLYRTRWGLSLRSVGESPATADALGVNVVAVRYGAVFFGGLLAGVGGAYLSVVYAPAWIEGMTAGAGWIVIALTIFAMWDPLRALLGAYLFGGVRVLQYRLQPLGISPNLLAMLPFIFTILVLVASAGEAMRRRIGAPAALMQPYTREER
ncbi:MAG: ABC transporter permease [Anaerolineaceae bacterium]|nr:MAG: ABC transporter permease [Anaerolineaceae bacterium]